MAQTPTTKTLGAGLSHWHSHPLHHHQRHGGKSNGDDGGGMGSQDTTIIGSSSPGATPGLKDRFSALETGMVGSVPGSSFGPEEGGGVGEGDGRRDGAVGQITRTISFRVSSVHYPDNHDGDDVEGRQRMDGKEGGRGSQQQQQQEWPLNPLSPVDGVSPWYCEDEEALGRGVRMRII